MRVHLSGRRPGHEQPRPVCREQGLGLNTELFVAFADRRVPRVLAGFEVAARWQPQPGLVVLDEQDLRIKLEIENGLVTQAGAG